MSLTLEDFDYDLPPHLIAQQPLAERSDSRLLVVDAHQLEDGRFHELPRLLERGDLLVFNDSQVIHARLLGVKASGGRVEMLIERMLGEHEALAQIRASHPPRPGSTIRVDNALDIEVVAREGEFFRLRFPPAESPATFIERHGTLPLPPYIQRPAAEQDERRYQTVYARDPGSVAAPTAGLHFDQPLLRRLEDAGMAFAYVTLHVGAGTFQPVRANDLAQHRMHSERFAIPDATMSAIAHARNAGRRVIAVGTTTLRALEAAARRGELRPGTTETDLFILPGFRFRVADCLITNFHLPRSTLLMLVSAFAGMDTIRAAYQHAVARQYRFFSYGDAMLLTRPTDEV